MFLVLDCYATESSDKIKEVFEKDHDYLTQFKIFDF